MQSLKFELNATNMVKLRSIATSSQTLPQAVRRVVEEFGVSEGEARSLLAKDEGPGAKLYREEMNRPYTGER